jgi:hypothetical protein
VCFLFLDPQNKIGPSIYSSVVLCSFALLIYMLPCDGAGNISMGHQNTHKILKRKKLQCFKKKTFSTDSGYPMSQQKYPSISLGTNTTAASGRTVPIPPFDRDSSWFFDRLIFIKLSKHVTTMKWGSRFFTFISPQ